MATKRKIVSQGTKARKELIEGADFLADAVKSTLGPFGQNWLLEKGERVTNDGVTIAREIEHPKEIQQRGLTTLRQAAIKTNDEAGDGTTTSITIAQAILRDVSRFLGDDEKGIIAKKSGAEILKQIEVELKEISGHLETMSTKIESKEQLIESARVSVEDDELGQLIGGMQWDLGPEGIIIAEETAEKTCSIEKIQGLRIDNGFGTSLLLNNHEKQTLEVEDCHIILTNHTIKDLQPLKKLIEQLHKSGVRQLAIVARAFTPEAIQVCLQNVNEGSIKTYPMNAPYVDQAEVMKDLAAVLGATFYHEDERDLRDIQPTDVGIAGKIIARRYDALLTGKPSEKSQERIDARVKELEQKLEGEASDFEKRNLRGRIAQLKNGFALLKIGAETDTARKYKKDKADDAVNAVRAAYQEGVVPGAGMALKIISANLPDSYILKRAIVAPYEQIMYLAPKGFKVEDWVKDPLKVIRIALKNACSVAGILATAGGATATKYDKPLYTQVADQQNQDE